MNERFIRKLMSTIKCGVCGENYETSSIEILGHQDNTWFLNASCPACHSRALVAAILNDDKLLDTVTDLSEAELTTLSETNTISADDILDVHNYLNGFDGDFINLFNQNDRAVT